MRVLVIKPAAVETYKGAPTVKLYKLDLINPLINMPLSPGLVPKAIPSMFLVEEAAFAFVCVHTCDEFR